MYGKVAVVTARVSEGQRGSGGVNWQLTFESPLLIQTIILDPSDAIFNGADNKNYIEWPFIGEWGGGVRMKKK